MLKRLLIKKEYLLILASIVLLWLSYKLAFKGTIEAWQNNRQLKTQLTRSTDLSYQPGYLERKNSNLDKILKLYKADTAAFRNNSINIISAIAEKESVKLSEVPMQDPFYHTDKFIIQKLGFEGDFFSLTKVLHQLQLTNDIGIIRSATYKMSGTNPTTQKDKKLVLEVCLEIARGVDF